MFYCTLSGDVSIFVYQWASLSLWMGQLSNSVATHPCINEVEVGGCCCVIK